jgi:ribose 5-phosphate isomerase B
MPERFLHIGSDHAGTDMKEALCAHLRAQDRFTVLDHGVCRGQSADYPVQARAVCRAVLADADGTAPGILICGTGIGMSMAANRYRGIRAALCGCEFHARAAREHNNANVLCLGARVTGLELALSVVEAFLEASFHGGRHERRVNLIDAAPEG